MKGGNDYAEKNIFKKYSRKHSHNLSIVDNIGFNIKNTIKENDTKSLQGFNANTIIR